MLGRRSADERHRLLASHSPKIARATLEALKQKICLWQPSDELVSVCRPAGGLDLGVRSLDSSHAHILVHSRRKHDRLLRNNGELRAQPANIELVDWRSIEQNLLYKLFVV